MDYVVKLNPEPTEVQLAQFRRHRDAGTSPGNPKWYLRECNNIVPFAFKAGRPAKLPHLPTGADWNRKHSRTTAKGLLATHYVDGTTHVDGTTLERSV